MTARKTNLTEAQFRLLLAGEIRAMLIGKKSLTQVEYWLRDVRPSGAPLADLRIRTFIYALSMLAFGQRADPGEEKKMDGTGDLW